MSDTSSPSLWVRVIADERFREALIGDPLRALADFDDVAVSPEQVRQLEDLDLDERRELVMEVYRRAFTEGAAARFGEIGPDGRLGGG